MSYITHFRKQPVNVQYWDYYILCRLNTDATIALQRMEYWDGTKEDGNIHAENINDALIQQGQEPTQDTGNWIYKSGDELLWELMGVTGERRLPKLLSFLIDEVGYLAQRNNPINTWDRKKQYCVQRRLIQQHINYLGYIIDYFDMPMARMTPVFYAIERLTAEKCYIDKINVEKVLEMIEKMKNDEKLPHFLKHELTKFTQTFSKPDFIPFRNFAECIAQNCGMHSAITRCRSGKNAESIPQKCGSNSIEDIHNKTNIEDLHNNVMVVTAHADDSATSHTISLSEKNEAEENPTPEPTTEQGVTPPTKKEIAPRRSPASKKNKSSKKNETADLLALSEIPAPQKPDPATQGYNVELFMKLANYYRGSELAESNNPNSRYQKALKSAMALVQRKAPFERVDKLFCFMLGRGEEIGRPKLIDQKWIDGCYPTDLWVVENHYTDKWLECQRLEQVLYGIAPNAKQSKSSGEGMTHDEAQEVVRDAIAKGKQHGYSIKAQAVCEQGVWLVKIDWDGDPLTMRSSAEWEKTFTYNYEEDQKELALMKGAN